MAQMDLNGYRTYVREYLDLEQEDLSDLLIDRWVQEGVDQVTYLIKRWSFYETVLPLVVDGTAELYDVPLRSIYSIEGAPKGGLRKLDPSAAADHFHTIEDEFTPGEPQAWVPWNLGQVRIYPRPDQVYNLTVRGHRDPVRLTGAAGETADVPERFDNVVLSWVLHRAYFHQGDEDYARMEVATFEKSLAMLANEDQMADVAPREIMGGGNRNLRQGQTMRDPQGPGLGGWGA